MSKSSKHVTLTLAQKLQVIRETEKGKSSRQLAQQFGVGKTQINNINKRKREFLDLEEDNAPSEKKRCTRPTGNEDVNKLTYGWFCDAVNRRVEVTGPMLQERALEFAKELGNENFKASNGWKQSFIQRNNIAFGKLNGESGDVSTTVVTDWKEKIPTLIEDYEPRDIYNMDETGLYFKTTQDKTFYNKGAKPGGGKKSKERVTISVCTNMIGEKETILLIGKAARPRAFKSVDPASLPVTYKFNKKAWMTSAIFSSWLHTFNEKMKNQGRNVLLFLDNAPSHSKDKLSNVTLRFFPANTTSVLQPLDQGVIQALKLKYRKRQYRHIMLEMKKNSKTGIEMMKEVNILQAIIWIDQAWKEVSKDTINKCFIKCGFGPREEETEETQVQPDEQPPKEFNLLSEELTGLPFESLSLIDQDIDTEDTELVDWTRPSAEILKQIKDKEECDDSDDDQHDDQQEENTEQTTVADALAALSTLKTFYMQKSMINELQTVQSLDKSMYEVIPNMSTQATLDKFGFK